MKRLMALGLILCATSLASGCVTARASFCDTSRPIRPSVDDQFTDGTARQILKHNTYGAQACGWKAGR